MGVFGNRRIRSGTERLAFTQTARVPLERWLSPSQGLRPGAGALTAQVTVGRIGTFYDGAIGALRWEPGEGRHRLSAQAGAFRNNEYDNGFGPLGTVRTAKPVLASYRYSVMATRTDLEATGGQFMNNDRGVQLGMRQWFSDVSVGVYYKRDHHRGQPGAPAGGRGAVASRSARAATGSPCRTCRWAARRASRMRVETSIREGRGNPLRAGARRAPTHTGPGRRLQLRPIEPRVLRGQHAPHPRRGALTTSRARTLQGCAGTHGRMTFCALGRPCRT